jgi:hypothetical protein
MRQAHKSDHKRAGGAKRGILSSGTYGSGEVYSIQHDVIKFVSGLWQVGGFLQVLRFHPPIKNDRHNITQILLKVALNTITLTLESANVHECVCSQDFISIIKLCISVSILTQARKYVLNSVLCCLFTLDIRTGVR